MEYEETVKHLVEWKELARWAAEGRVDRLLDRDARDTFIAAAHEGWPATIALAEKLMEDNAMQRTRIRLLEKRVEVMGALAKLGWRPEEVEGPLTSQEELDRLYAEKKAPHDTD